MKQVIETNTVKQHISLNLINPSLPLETVQAVEAETVDYISLDLSDLNLSDLVGLEDSALAGIVRELNEESPDGMLSRHSSHTQSHSSYSTHGTFTW